MDEPEYDVDKAKIFIHSALSPELQQKFSPEDIAEIIELELEYLEKSGFCTDMESNIVEYPRNLDYEEMYYYIIHEAVKIDLYITWDELVYIMEAETEYLYQIGAIDPDDQLERFFN